MKTELFRENTGYRVRDYIKISKFKLTRERKNSI